MYILPQGVGHNTCKGVLMMPTQRIYYRSWYACQAIVWSTSNTLCTHSDIPRNKHVPSLPNQTKVLVYHIHFLL